MFVDVVPVVVAEIQQFGGTVSLMTSTVLKMKLSKTAEVDPPSAATDDVPSATTHGKLFDVRNLTPWMEPDET